MDNETRLHLTKKVNAMYKINPCVADVVLNQQSICNLCNKKVVDLTELTEGQVADLMIQEKGELCGISTISNFNSSYYLHPFRRFALAILIVFGSSVFTLSVQAQEVVQNIQNDTLNKNQSTKSTALIKGVVLDKSTNEPIPFVNVWYEINGVKYGASTDFDGKFNVITQPLFFTNDSILNFTLNIQTLGYSKMKLENIKIEQGKTLDLGTIQLVEEELKLMGYIIEEKYDFISDPDYHRSTTIKREEINRIPKNR